MRGISVLLIALLLATYSKAGSWQTNKPLSKPAADQRCNADFINKLTAQNECLVGQGMACLYLMSLAHGLSAGAAGGLLGIAAHHLQFDAQFLKKFKAAHEAITGRRFQYQVFIERLRSARKNIHSGERVKPSDSRALVQNDVMKQQYKKELLKAFEDMPSRLGFSDLNNFIKSDQWSPQNIEEKFRQKLILDNTQTLQDIFENKAIKHFEKLRQKHLSLVKTAEREADPTYVADVRVIQKRMSDALSANNMAEYETASDYYLDRVARHWELSQNQVASVVKEFHEVREANYPELKLYNYLSQSLDPAHSLSGGPDLQIVIQQLRNKLKGSKIVRLAKGAAAAGGLGLVAEATLHISLDQKIKHCAENLKLTQVEQEIVRPHIAGHSLLGACREMRLRDEYDVMVKAVNIFGYVPVGICEMVYKESKTYENVLEEPLMGDLINLSCNNIHTSAYGANIEDENSTFYCIAGEVKYEIPINEYYTVQFSEAKAVARGRERPVLATDLRAQLREVERSTEIRRQNEVYCEKNKEKSARCLCLKSSQVSSAVLRANELMPQCEAKASSRAVRKAAKAKKSPTQPQQK